MGSHEARPPADPKAGHQPGPIAVQNVINPRPHGEAALLFATAKPVCTSTPTSNSRNEIGASAAGHSSRARYVNSPNESKLP